MRLIDADALLMENEELFGGYQESDKLAKLVNDAKTVEAEDSLFAIVKELAWCGQYFGEVEMTLDNGLELLVNISFYPQAGELEKMMGEITKND